MRQGEELATAPVAIRSQEQQSQQQQRAEQHLRNRPPPQQQQVVQQQQPVTAPAASASAARAVAVGGAAAIAAPAVPPVRTIWGMEVDEQGNPLYPEQVLAEAPGRKPTTVKAVAVDTVELSKERPELFPIAPEVMAAQLEVARKLASHEAAGQDAADRLTAALEDPEDSDSEGSVYDAFHTVDPVGMHGTLPGAGSSRDAAVILGSFPERLEPVQPKHVMLQIFYAARAPLLVRHPGTLPMLRRRLARLLALNEGSLRLSAEVTSEERAAPRPEAPRFMRLRVTGAPLVSGIDMGMVLLSWVNVCATALFCAVSLLTAHAPAPYVYAAPLPLVACYVHSRAAMSALQQEFLVNRALRDILQRKAAEICLMMLLSLLGPDSVIFFAGIALQPRGVQLSDQCLNALRGAAAYTTPLVLDLPLLFVNYLLHRRTGVPWDVSAMFAFAVGLLSLLLLWPWRVLRVLRARRRQSRRDKDLYDDGDDTVGEGSTFEWSARSAALSGRQAAPALGSSPVRQRLREEAESRLRMSEERLASAETKLEDARERTYIPQDIEARGASYNA